MHKLKLYVETSAWSHWYADEAPEKRDRTREFFERCEAIRDDIEIVIGQPALEEVAQADEPKRQKLESLIARLRPKVVAVSDEVAALADAYIAMGAVPPSKHFDALHAALASVELVDVLVSWNCRHLVSYQREMRINGVNMFQGYDRHLRLLRRRRYLHDGKSDNG